MNILNLKFLINTNGNNDVLDITENAKEKILSKNVLNGLIHIYTPLSRAGIKIMEYDPGIVKDLNNFLEKIIPKQNEYFHDIEWKDNFANGYIKSALIGNGVCIPFIEGDFELDRFQRILFVDFDGTKGARSVIIQIIY